MLQNFKHLFNQRVMTLPAAVNNGNPLDIKIKSYRVKELKSYKFDCDH